MEQKEAKSSAVYLEGLVELSELTGKGASDEAAE